MTKFTTLCLILLLLLTATACETRVSDLEDTRRILDSETESNQPTDETRYADQRQKYIGNPVPDFRMLSLSGNMVDLGKTSGPFLLYFSRVDCPACVETLPLIEKVKGDGVPVITIYRRDSKREIVNLYEELGIEPDSDVILSGIEDSENNTVLETFDLIAVPTTFFVDENNIVKWIHIGGATNDELRDMCHEYLRD